MRLLVVDSDASVRMPDTFDPLDDVEHTIKVVRVAAPRTGVQVARASTRFRPDVILIEDDAFDSRDRRLVKSAARSAGAVIVVMFPVAAGTVLPEDERPDWAVVTGESQRALAIARFVLPPYRVVVIGDPQDENWSARMIGAFEKMAAIGPWRPILSPVGVRLAKLIVPTLVAFAEKRNGSYEAQGARGRKRGTAASPEAPTDSAKAKSSKLRKSDRAAEKAHDGGSPQSRRAVEEIVPPDEAVQAVAIAPVAPAGSSSRETRGNVLFIGTDLRTALKFEEAFRHLAARRFAVHIALEADSLGNDLAEQLRQYISDFTYVRLPALGERRSRYALILRWCLDYWHLLGRRSPQAREAARRMEQAAPRSVRKLVRSRLIRRGPVRRRAATILTSLERRIPMDPSVVAFLKERKLHLLIVAPWIDAKSSQVDYVRAARALGIRTLFCTTEWNQLSDGGMIHETPDCVAVWNRDQRKEAVELHGVLPQRTSVIGALGHSPPFEAHASSRSELAERFGFDAADTLIAYSAADLGRNEVKLLRDWVRALRSHPNPRLSGSAVIVRLGNARLQKAVAAELIACGKLAVVKRAGRTGTAALHHADAVVTFELDSALEAAILGRPVFSVIAEEHAQFNEELLRFHKVRRPGAPSLRLANCLDEHLRELSDVLGAENDVATDGITCDMRSWLRPHGPELSPGFLIATQLVADIRRS